MATIKLNIPFKVHTFIHGHNTTLWSNAIAFQKIGPFVIGPMVSFPASSCK